MSKKNRLKNRQYLLLFRFYLGSAVLVALFIFLAIVGLQKAGVVESLSEWCFKYMMQDTSNQGEVQGIFIEEVKAQSVGTNFNPSYPRIAFQYPAAESHFTVCEEIYAKFDLLGLSGANICNRIVKQKNPATIILGGFGNMDIESSDSNINFEHLVFRAADPQLIENVNAQAGPVDISVDRVNGLLNGRNENRPDAGEVVIFVGPDKGRPADLLNYHQLDKINYTAIDVNNNLIKGAYNISQDHFAGEYLKQPIKAGGWTPNVSDLNPYNQQATIKFYIDNKYTDRGNLAHVDGVLYDFFRSRGDEEEFYNVDFNLDWLADSQAQKRTAWQNGLRKMFDYEKQVTGKTKIITNDGFGIPDGAPAWLDGHILERGMDGFWSWQQYFEKLKQWERDDKIILAVDGKGYSWRDTSNFKNDFSAMRYGLSSAAMGNAFYGRAGGSWFYFTYIYDEYLTDLGYPTSEPQKIKCINRQLDQWSDQEYCVYVRFFDNGAVIVNQQYQEAEINDSDIRNLTGYDGPYYRFSGGQDAAVNNGQQLTDNQPLNLSGYYGGSNDKNNKGDGILLFKQNNYKAVADIIVGNFNNNDTSPGSQPVMISGNWQTRPRTNINNPYYSQWNQDDDSSSSEGIGYFVTTDSGAEAVFTPTIGVSGEYEIYEWHGWHGNQGGDDEATSVPYEVVVSGNQTAVGTINQRQNAGQWNLIGTFNLPIGEDSYLKISAQGANGPVVADAVKFVFTNNSQVDTSGARRMVADFNCDYKVDLIDFGILLSHWRVLASDVTSAIKNYEHHACDITISLDIAPDDQSTVEIEGDDIINEQDLGRLFSCWGSPNYASRPECWLEINDRQSIVNISQCGNGVMENDEVCDGQQGVPENAVCALDCNSWQCGLAYEVNNSNDGCQLINSQCRAKTNNQSSKQTLNMVDAELPPPGVGVSWCDAIFGSRITRLSEQAAVDEDGNEIGGRLAASSIAHWNSDNSLFYAELVDGNHLFNQHGDDLGLIETILPMNEIRWAAEPNIVYKVSGSSIEQCDIRNLSCYLIRDFSSRYHQLNWGRTGDLSANRRLASLSGQRNDRVEIFVFDFEHQFDFLPASSWSLSDFNDSNGGLLSHTVSADGNWVLVAWRKKGQQQRDYGIELFDNNLNFIKQLTIDNYDFEVGRDGDGNQFLVTTAGEHYTRIVNDPNIDNSNDVVRINLDRNSQNSYQLLMAAVGSGRMVFSMPVIGDYLVAAHYKDTVFEIVNPSQWQPYWFEILMVPIDGSQNIRRLAHHRSNMVENVTSYLFAKPEINVTTDGRYILFKSTMNDRGTDLYLLEMP